MVTKRKIRKIVDCNINIYFLLQKNRVHSFLYERELIIGIEAAVTKTVLAERIVSHVHR